MIGDREPTTSARPVGPRAAAESPTRNLTIYARRLGFGTNATLFARYLEALHELTGRSGEALLLDAAGFFRNTRPATQEYARYFVLAEERMLYTLWLARYAIEHRGSALMFVARGAEPFHQAWHLWRPLLAPQVTLPDAFLLRVCRGYAGDARLDAEPRYFLSRSLLSALTDEERSSPVPARTWSDVDDVATATGLRDELNAYLQQEWKIGQGLDGLIGGPPKTRQTALTCLADFGIDPSYRRLVWRNRRACFGTDGIARLMQAGTCTAAGVSAWVRQVNATRLGGAFDDEDMANMEAGLLPLVDRRGMLPERCRELVSSVMRIYLNARLLKRLRGRTEHKARPLLNVLLRDTAVGRTLGGPGLEAVASVDESTVSGTSLIAAELCALSFNASLRHVSLNMAQRTASASAFLTAEGILDACAAGGVWFQEDMSHFYGGCYDGDMRYVPFAALARRLRGEQPPVAEAVYRGLLEEMEDRLQPLIAALLVEVPSHDGSAHVQLRYPIDVIMAHIVKQYLRGDHALAFECQRIVLDGDVLQMVSVLQCDFTGWFFLRQMRDRAFVWLDAHQEHLPELRALRELDRQVRFHELAGYFERMARRHEAGLDEMQQAAVSIAEQLGSSLGGYLHGRVPFAALRSDFYARFRCP